MKDNLFEKEIIVPDEVRRRVDQTLAKIQKEETIQMKHYQSKHYKKQIAILLAAAVVGTTGITAGATVYHRWSRGIQKGMQATEEQQQSLTENGMAVVYGETSDYQQFAVTQNGVTVTPEMAIVDENTAKLTFTVSGYQMPNGEQPTFENLNLTFDSLAEEDRPNISWSFYDGTITDDDDMALNDDGTALNTQEAKWVDENGTMELVINLWKNEDAKTLLGQSLHIDLNNFGYYSGHEEDVAVAANGTWSFDLKLPEKSAARVLTIDQEVSCKYNRFVIDQVLVSPISTQINYHLADGEAYEQHEDAVDEQPHLVGYVLKDGTRLSCNAGGGSQGPTDESLTTFSEVTSHSRIVDVEEIEKLIIRLTPGGEEMTLEIQ